MIFHTGQIDGGKVLPELVNFGLDAVVSPKTIPFPTNRTALVFHIKRGALLCRIVNEPPLFDTSELVESLKSMKNLGAANNQLMLFLVTEDGDGHREIYRESAREWVKNGGSYFVLNSADDLETQLSKWEDGVAVEMPNLARLMSQLPHITPELAKDIVDEYGVQSLVMLTLVVNEGSGEKLDVFSRLTNKQIKDIGEIWNE